MRLLIEGGDTVPQNSSLKRTKQPLRDTKALFFDALILNLCQVELT